jgi:hypothetical protein
MSIPHISEARRLADDTVAVGGVFPAVLTTLINLVDSVKALPPAPDPTALLIDDALAGKSVDLSKLITTAAKAETEAEYAKRLHTMVERDAIRRFQVELSNSGGQLILDSITPAFDETAAAIAAATAVVDISWTPDQLVSTGTPEQLAAWQKLPALVARVDKFAALAAGFGRHGTFALIETPGHLVHNEIVGLRDEALLLTDSDPWRASDLVHARRADWRTSPWVRMPLRLNTIDEAKERLRVLCEAAFDAIELSRGVQGRMTDDGWRQDPRRPNPFALPEAAQA